MDPTSKALFLCLALATAHGAPTHHHDSPTHAEGAHAVPDRCAGIEFDAITLDEHGVTYFFKDDYVWKGYQGPAELSDKFFKELDDHHVGHVDAAFRMHKTGSSEDHDHIYFFLEDKVFRYHNHTLEDGYPKQIQDEFPGIPSHLDSAVECPQHECSTDSVLFFKGHDVHVYDIATQAVKTKTWPDLPVCTSALRWLESYYCFSGHNFTRFNPVSGVVSGNYPKDARNYFMRCSNFGHGGGSKPQKCSDVKLDAITTDDAGKSYFFAGPIYMRLDSHRDGHHPFPITRTWIEMTHGVDAVFSYANRIYMIKEDQIFIYKAAVPYTLVEGYPKTLKEELGIEGHVDAAFLCNNEHTVHIIQGNRMLSIDLTPTPRTVTREVLLPLSDIDAAHCGRRGIAIFKGSQYYSYENSMLLAGSKVVPEPHHITSELMGCED